MSALKMLDFLNRQFWRLCFRFCYEYNSKNKCYSSTCHRLSRAWVNSSLKNHFSFFALRLSPLPLQLQASGSALRERTLRNVKSKVHSRKPGLLYPRIYSTFVDPQKWRRRERSFGTWLPGPRWSPGSCHLRFKVRNRSYHLSTFKMPKKYIDRPS